MGREGELAELTALLDSSEVRLVTLTGPGGSGKTRLAIGLAERLVAAFSDGVYFVPLAAVTTADVLWTSIAEVLNVPPEGRAPPGFFDHVAHRRALFVLDNLEQVESADGVVAEFLERAAHTVVIATSRRPLALPAEHVRPVPPLDLPRDADLDEARGSSAVQLFAQQARKVKPPFALTAENVPDVTAICRRLDGLPLAIELAAARARLLTPKALLARLDSALDISAPGTQAPTRQKTLRDTIAWSYDLLSPQQQAFFRRLGIFAGGADLEAIDAICADIAADADVLEVVAVLADSSLAIVTEDVLGEPRIGLLATIRAFAREKLGTDAELAIVQRRHATYFLVLAENLQALWSGQQDTSRQRFDTELDNFREALTWALPGNADPAPSSDQVEVGQRLCKALGWFWLTGGYFDEARRWLEQALTVVDLAEPSLLTSENLARLAHVVSIQGDFDRGRELAAHAVAAARPFGDSPELGYSLLGLAWGYFDSDEHEAARGAFEEALAVTLNQADPDPATTTGILADFALFESQMGNFDRSIELHARAAELVRKHGNLTGAAILEWNMINVLVKKGDVIAAYNRCARAIDQTVALGDPGGTVSAAETYSQVLLLRGAADAAAELLGAAVAMRERIGTIRPPGEEAEFQRLLTNCRTAAGDQRFRELFERGRVSVPEALMLAFKPKAA